MFFSVKVNISFGEAPVAIEEDKDELIIGSGSTIDIDKQGVQSYHGVYIPPPDDFQFQDDSFFANFYTDKNIVFGGFTFTWIFGEENKRYLVSPK